MVISFDDSSTVGCSLVALQQKPALLMAVVPSSVTVASTVTAKSDEPFSVMAESVGALASAVVNVNASLYDVPCSLVAYAQLRDGLHVEEELVEKPALPQNTMDAERDKEEIFFVLNDSVVYTSMSEFKSATARNSYQEWHNMHQQMKLDKDLLARLRLQYATSDDATKKELTPQILQLEKKQSQSQEQFNKLLQTVRKSENEVNQQ